MNEQQTFSNRSGRSFVVGTAGHVDHGKSTLVKALTGIDPDRLTEEKARAMTIELGFAWLDLPSGRTVGVVDVPGHERFIKTMLSGVGGIDAALLIVAADEGPMPQTEEHLAILDLLQVRHGIVVLTKADTVDQDWLELVQEEIRERIGRTSLAGAPVVAVSAVTGAGLAELKAAIDGVLDQVSPRLRGGFPRLPIDRVFTMPGFGTVVTGTLQGASLVVGQDVRVYPGEQVTKIRGLQSHGQKRAEVSPGNRTAVNLASLGVGDVRRGDVLAPPGALMPSLRLDVRLYLLADAPLILEQNSEVEFFTGASEVSARLTLLDREQLEPGDEGWVQVRLRQPLAVVKGDRFIVRRPSPSVTIGGGEVVDAAPARHRRFNPDILAALETISAGDPAEIILQQLSGPREVRSLLGGRSAGLGDTEVLSALARLLATGDVRSLARHDELDPRPGDFLVAADGWGEIATRVSETVAAFHAGSPLRSGISKEELKRRLKLSPPRLADEVIASLGDDGRIVDDGQSVRLASFRIVLDGPRRAAADRFLKAVRAAPTTPPAPAEFGIDADTVGAMVELGELVRVADGVVFAPETVAEISRETVRLIDEGGPLSLAVFRDRFGTSRKYAQAILEYLDSRQVTRRVGDERVKYSGVGSRRERS